MGNAKRMSKQERDEARRRWLLRQKGWKQIQAKLAEMVKLGLSDAQIEEKFRDELGLLVVAEPVSPAEAFVEERMSRLSPNDPEFVRKAGLVLVDLGNSGIPLDGSPFRSIIANEMHCLLFPSAERARRQEDEVDARVAEGMKYHLRTERGMTAAEAEHMIATKAFGTTVPALRKRLQRHPKISGTKN